ncbi:hypothetical protein INS49_006270 [Diaporthe citri]|uniref:uncharacterized protein n=1 Tax=Diaporthe citri TaxID=83186 RepID=UPI001C8161E2|nr:uncharacterized protein INS49_006270 [Diaporthe citri]KAG6364666.1 hypothetical protein INS49_006270 [Diaporthe citri]
MDGMALEISRFRGWVQVKELVAYLDELRTGVADADSAICQSILQAVEQNLVSPDVFSIFISWSKSPAVIARCLNYESNTKIRRFAIRELGKHLRRPGKFDWELTWKALGGTEGLVQIFGRSSVDEVKTMSMLIGGCNRGKKHEQTQRCVEELLRALLPGVYASTSTIQSNDRRPIQQHYAIMLPACSQSFVNEVLDSRDDANPLYRWRDLKRLVRSHRALLRGRAISHLFSSGPEDEDAPSYLDTFLFGDREFAIKALQGRLDGTVTDERWGHNDEIAVLMRNVRRLAKHWKAPVEKKRRIHDLIKLGLEILGKDRERSSDLSDNLWAMTFSRWQIWPDHYEDVLRLGLQLDLAERPHKDPRSYLPVLRRLEPGPRERLLQLCYLDIPGKPLDLFAAEDYSAVARQTWPFELFRLMSTDQAIRLLKKLYQANPEYNFLETSDRTSILPVRDVGPQRNFNVDLYLTILQRDKEKVQQNSRDTIERLRKKASAARDQSDRASLAKAAACYAIATGDLDVYGETVVWQKRFVKDPLTAKVLFSRDVVRSVEGIELLLGTPTLDTLSATCKDSTPLLLDEISRGIKSADAVLRTFQESYLLAKREPSFQEYDWTHVKGLFTAVFSSRFSRSETLQRHFNVPRNEVFRIVWKGLLAALEWLNADFLQAIRTAIQELLGKSRPEFLADATRSLLDIGTEGRKRKEEKGASHQAPAGSPGVFPIGFQTKGMPASPPPGFPSAIRNSKLGDETLEQMSYDALTKLANSDMPALASPLILQTILERPDASSWHRILLSVGFLKRLRAEEAHELLLGLAKGIGEKLEEQSYVRVGESEPPKHAPSQPAVKVTTVKYLAQLLNNAEFISNDAAAEVLIELFRAAQHRDIRIAALESLLNLLDGICTGTQEELRASPVVRNIMAALKTVVPVAGSINERRPLRKEDWTEAETTGMLPELSETPLDRLPPLMRAVVSAVEFRSGLKKLEKEFVEHIVLPVLEQSQQEHTRWVNMFLAKHKATALGDLLPETPIVPLLWTTVLCNYYRFIPKEHLAAFNRYAIHRIAPTPAIEKFSASLRADTELWGNPEVQHWLESYAGGDFHPYRSPTNTLFTLLNSVQDEPAERAVLLDMILQHAALYLEEYEKYTDMWDNFVNSLEPRAASGTMEDEVEYKRWYDNRRFIALQVINLVRNKRQQGRRLILPSTTKLELWLLFTMGWYSADDSCNDFASRLEEHLLAVLQEDETCALRWYEVARATWEVVEAVLNTDDERLRVAYHIGRLGQAGQAAGETSRQLRVALDLVKLEVTLELIGSCETDKIGDSLTRRLEEWRACDSDTIRRMVFQWEASRSTV